VSNFFANEGGDTCVTTGWPFLQAGAFVDKDGMNRTMIVLNRHLTLPIISFVGMMARF